MMMRKWMGTVCLVVCVFALGGAVASAAAQEYDSADTEELVSALIEAQGGLTSWEAARAVRYDHIMFTPSIYQEGDTHWWTSRETIEHGRQRAYHEWPIDGAQLGFDGESAWSLNWKRPNSPAGMARINYFLTFMTWLTQEEDAVLTKAEPRVLPGDDGESLGVNLAFGEGDPPFGLFIDPVTHRLRGFRNRGTLHVVHGFGDADGLSIPSDWTTYAGEEVIGHHSVINAELLERFDESLLVAPDGAVIAR